MTQPTDIGLNRTGAGLSPIDTARTAKGAAEDTSSFAGEAVALHDLELEFSRNAPPIGHMPPPATLKGVAKTGVQALKGKDVAVFLDKMGERLAFERTGTRLYEALLVKFDASHPHEGGPTRAEIERIRDEELKHFGLLAKAFVDLGADPTAVTPCADVTFVASSGIPKVLTDPRTTLTQCLDAILIAELADNDGWRLLIELAEGLGKDDLARQFHQALREEDDHLANVRRWVKNALVGQAGIHPTPPAPQAGARAPSPRH